MNNEISPWMNDGSFTNKMTPLSELTCEYVGEILYDPNEKEESVVAKKPRIIGIDWNLESLKADEFRKQMEVFSEKIKENFSILKKHTYKPGKSERPFRSWLEGEFKPAGAEAGKENFDILKEGMKCRGQFVLSRAVMANFPELYKEILKDITITHKDVDLVRDAIRYFGYAEGFRSVQDGDVSPTYAISIDNSRIAPRIKEVVFTTDNGSYKWFRNLYEK